MASKREYFGNIRAPEFPAGLEWVNTEHPLSLAELRGKLVLLDFWTYGCINCMHVIPDLKRLEALYPDELVVVGVHAAKFANEGDSANIRNIVMRYELEHPVVNDRNFDIWRSYAVRAWPTTILIDPRGFVLAAHSGEGVLEAYGEVIAAAIKEYETKGLLDRRPLKLVERARAGDTLLSFPGKVLADEQSGRLFIADSNHHRIVITDLEGIVRQVIGTGVRALRDGSLEEAGFAKPQGMALDGDQLYIADTENHAIRRADLTQHTVSTVAGNGMMGYRTEKTRPAQAHLNSPWDLVLVGRDLYIAMAGIHQLWKLSLDHDLIGPYAGTGREGLVDGPLDQAALAQPSGITSDGRVLYFADSEASAVRSAGLGPQGDVSTIVGQGLFDFGDVDGDAGQGLLQHDLGITYYHGTLYVADTYNHKIKIVDPANRRVTTFLGSGAAGQGDGMHARFYEPGGLAAAEGKLYIADTNNHAIRVADLVTRQVETLYLVDPKGLLTQRGQSHRASANLVHLAEQRVRPGEGLISFQVHLPKGYKLTEGAPSFVTWEKPQDGVLQIREDERTTDLTAHTFPVEIKATFSEGRAALRGELSLAYCKESVGLCLIWPAELEIPVTVTKEAKSSEMQIEVDLKPAR